MEVRPGYKQTEVGLIPQAWEVRPLSRVADIRGGIAKNANSSISAPISVHYLRVANVQDGFLNLGEMSRIELSRGDLLRYKVLPGDVLMTEGGDLDKLGRGAIWRGEFDPCVHQNHVFVVRCKADLIPEYLNIWTATSPVRRFFLVAGKQTTNLASISKSSLGELPVALPSLPEQRAIAAALNDIDALLAGLDRLIVKKRDLKQAAMQQLLTGQTRLPGFQGEWEVTRLGDAGKCLRGVSYRGDRDLSSHDTNHTRRLLRSNNVQAAAVVTAEVQYVNAERVSLQQSLMEDDILICMANGSKALVGKAGLFRVRDGYQYTFGAFMGCFRTSIPLAHPVFVFYLFQTGRYRDYVNNLLAGSSINNLRPSSVESLEFSMPDKSEQAAIAAVLSDMDAELTALEARRAKTRALKQAMMQELLTGKTRLV